MSIPGLDMNTVDKHALPVGRLRAWGHTEDIESKPVLNQVCVTSIPVFS